MSDESARSKQEAVSSPGEETVILDTGGIATEAHHEVDPVEHNDASSLHHLDIVAKNENHDISPKSSDVEATAANSDPGPPYSVFSKKMKILIVVMTTIGSLFSPLSSTIYLPALNSVAKSLDVSISKINLTVTSYMIFQGLAPMFFSDIGDFLGRRPVYVLAFTINFFANLGLAMQDSYAALFVLRAMQSTGSSATIALGSGVMSDIVTSAERGSYVAYVQMGTQLGPALAPTIGGLLAQYLGWRAIFWFLVICGGIYLSIYVIFVPETARNVVQNGSIPPEAWARPLIYYIRRDKNIDDGVSPEEKKRIAKELTAQRPWRFPNPLHSLRIVVEKDVACMLFVASVMVTMFQCMVLILPSAYRSLYGYNDLIVGLCYMPFSFGSIIGTILCGKFLDYNYRRLALKTGFPIDRKRGQSLRHFPIERARLEIIFYPLILGTLGVIAWGWILEAKAHVSAAIIIFAVAAFGLSGAMGMFSTFLVDLYPQSPATATAALNVTRCSMSAVGTALVQYMIDAWGYGWCLTFWGLLTLASTPLLLVVLKWGPGWREERFVRLEKRQAVKDQAKAEKKEKEEKQ